MEKKQKENKHNTRRLTWCEAKIRNLRSQINIRGYIWVCRCFGRTMQRGGLYLGDGVFWEVLVGEVTGLDQLAGDLGVWRVKGLPIGAWNRKRKNTDWWEKCSVCSKLCIVTRPDTLFRAHLCNAARVLQMILKQLGGPILKGFGKSCQQHGELWSVQLEEGD